MVEMSIPHLFRCPISLDLFTDPVTLSTGQTYDRFSIQKWFEEGHLTCPVTMQQLHDTTLVPNHTLRHLIEQWLLKGPGLNCQLKQPGPGSNSGSTGNMEWSLRTLKGLLQSKSATSESKVDVLKKVRNLWMDSDVGRACLIQLGFFSLLLELIFQSPAPFLLCNQELLESSLDCLLTFSPSTHLDSLNNVLTKDIKFASLVLFLSQGNAKIKISLCHLLETIATSDSTEALAIMIGQSPHVMRSLVSILDSKTDMLVSEAAVQAINGLCSLKINRENAIKGGAMHGLVKYLSNISTTKNASPKALATLDCLLELEIGKKNLAKIANNSLIRVLVKHIFMVSSENEGSEYAISVLLAMCGESSWARGEAVNAGVVTQLLFLIQSQCSSRAKTKARSLLLLLRSKCRRCDKKL
ncbi:U-box domain-containing protein 26-like [Carex rostrata]